MKPSTWPRPWREWRGVYQKIEYDVLLKSGQIIPNCWPNAGKLNRMDGKGGSYLPSKLVKFRRAANPLMDDIPKWVKK